MCYFINFEYPQKRKTQKENFFNSKTGIKKETEHVCFLFFESVQKSSLHFFLYNF